jgi:hypothetical protein
MKGIHKMSVIQGITNLKTVILNKFFKLFVKPMSHKHSSYM